jgi:hypothetical protein
MLDFLANVITVIVFMGFRILFFSILISDTLLSCNAGSPDLEYFVSFLVLFYLFFLFIFFIYLCLLGWRSHEL